MAETNISGLVSDPLTVGGHWRDVLNGEARALLEKKLLAYLLRQRWFGGKAQQATAAVLDEAIPLSFAGKEAVFARVRVHYAGHPANAYMVPLLFVTENSAASFTSTNPNAIVCAVDGAARGFLVDAVPDHDFCRFLVEFIRRGERLEGENGEMVAAPAEFFAGEDAGSLQHLEVAASRTEQTNSSILFGDQLILKLFRRSEAGLNPDIEIGRFLTGPAGYSHTPPVAGTIEYRPRDGAAASAGILQKFVPNRGDAWRHTLQALESYFDGAGGSQDTRTANAKRGEVGPYIDDVDLLARRTAEMHAALASGEDQPAFAPEAISREYRESLSRAMAAEAHSAIALLEKNAPAAQGGVGDDAHRLIGLKDEIDARFEALRTHEIDADRIRIHGDFHLGQVLFTGDDFYIIDFEGEPARPLEERRSKDSPIRDVVGMLRSFHYAAYAALFDRVKSGVPAGEAARLESYAKAWHAAVVSVFLESYLKYAGTGRLVPRRREEFDILLNAYRLQKAFYELTYELNNRPDWVRIPVSGLLQLLQPPETTA